MRIGYAKLGRSMGLKYEKHGYQGDAEAPNLLRRLATTYPQHTWVIVGKNNGGNLDLPNVTNAWDDGATPDEVEYYIANNLDAVVCHLGQHCTSQFGIPPSEYTWAQVREGMAPMTNPYESCKTYGGFLTRGLNALGDRTDGKAPVVWLCADPRNFQKNRSLKWPTGNDHILSQYRYTRDCRHERFEDPRCPEGLGFGDWCRSDRGGEIWVSKNRYDYADLETMMLPDDWRTWGQRQWEDRAPIGIATTSFNVGKPRRSQLVRDYLLNYFPDAEVHGKWDEVSLGDVPEGTVQQSPADQFQQVLEGWRVTAALPALGSGWTTAKVYQCFAANVACLLVGNVDEQGWTLPSRTRTPGANSVGEGLYSVRNDWTAKDLWLAKKLRVTFKSEVPVLAQPLIEDRDAWTQVIQAQSDLLIRRWDAHLLESTIGARLGL